MRLLPILFTVLCSSSVASIATAEGPPTIEDAADDGGACVDDEDGADPSVCAEDVGEAQDPLVANTVCSGLCSALAVAGCAGVTLACLLGSGLTLGGVSIPCIAAVPMACASGLGCVDACWSLFPLSAGEAASEW